MFASQAKRAPCPTSTGTLCPLCYNENMATIIIRKKSGTMILGAHPQLCLLRGRHLGRPLHILEALARPQPNQKCHSERNEESRFFKDLRSCSSLRMTKKPDLPQVPVAQGALPPISPKNHGDRKMKLLRNSTAQDIFLIKLTPGNQRESWQFYPVCQTAQGGTKRHQTAATRNVCGR
jgi:hypothetical protein